MSVIIYVSIPLPFELVTSSFGQELFNALYILVQEHQSNQHDRADNFQTTGDIFYACIHKLQIFYK